MRQGRRGRGDEREKLRERERGDKRKERGQKRRKKDEMK